MEYAEVLPLYLQTTTTTHCRGAVKIRDIEVSYTIAQSGHARALGTQQRKVPVGEQATELTFQMDPAKLGWVRDFT